MIKTPVSESEMKSILSNYDIGNYVSHKHNPIALTSTVYLLNTSTGKYIFKVLENFNDFVINYQINFLNFLSKNKVPIQEVIKDNNCRFFNKFKGINYVILEYVEGKTPKEIPISLVEQLAEMISVFHEVSLKYHAKRNFTWDGSIGHEFRIDKNTFEDVFGFSLLNEINSVVKEMKKNVNKSNLTPCIIHGDISPPNFIVKDDKLISFIDWAAVHFDYLAYDLSTVIANCFKNNEDYIKIFFKNYTVKLTEDDKKAVYYFIKTRKLKEFQWYKEQSISHPDQETKMKKECQKRIKEYKDFSQKFSLEDFLKLIS